MADKHKLIEAVLERLHPDGVPPPEPENRLPREPYKEKEGERMTRAQAIKMIKWNERGRQGREAFRSMLIEMRLARLEKQREEDKDTALDTAQASTLIQSAVRTFLAKRHVARVRDEELEFLGMVPAPAYEQGEDPREEEQRNMYRRKLTQRENREEYEEALVVLRQRVKEMEGQDMRETVQDAINAWFIDSRKPDGTYPEFPDEDDGGSKVILNPPPAPLEEAEGDGKKDKGKKEKGKKGKGKDEDEAADAEPTSQFVPDIEQSVKDFVERWQDKDESGNFWQKYDPELVKEEVRPLVFEEIRVEVDEEMRVLLENLVDMVEAERAAQRGGKYKKKKKKKGKKKGKGKGKGGKGKGKKYKDLTADRDPISIFTELVQAGLAKPLTDATLSDYVGGVNPIGSDMAQNGEFKEPSMAQVRQLVTEYCILPIGTKEVHEKAPYAKAVLLYGAPKTGKSLLAQCVANATGATLFDLSPTVTDGKYAGKSEQTKMVHMVFKMARLYAPSVIVIDHFEKLQIADNKKKKAYMEALGLDLPPNRIKKDVAKEYKFQTPGDQVLILGLADRPYEAVKKDRKAVVGFFQKFIYCPLPDYGSRVLLWRELFAKHGLPLPQSFDVSTLATLTQGYASGDIDAIVREIASERRIRRLLDHGHQVEMREVLMWMTRVPAKPREVTGAFHQWTSDLPARAVKDGDGGGGKKGKKK